MENLICNAYTFLEFNGTLEEYLNDSFIGRDPIPLQQKKINWLQIVDDYMKVSQYLNDEAIKQAHNLVMNEF